MTVEILRIHEDYVTEWLASPGGTKFRNRYKKCQRKNWMFVCSVFTRLRERKMARIAKSIRAAIDHFLRTPPHHKPFSIISDQANKLLEHL